MSERLRGLLVCSYNDMRGSYVTHRLLEEAREAGISLAVTGVVDTVMASDGSLLNGGAPVESADFALLRFKDGRIKDRMAIPCGRCYNALAPFNRFVDKYEQLLALQDSPVARPRYVLGTAETPFDAIAACVGTPFVAKGLRSSMGREVFLVHDEADQRSLVQRFGADREMLFESFIASSYGRDARLFVMRGEIACAMQRTSRDGFQANFARGAEVVSLGVNDEMRSCARIVYERTGLDYFGLDLLFGTSDLVFCEVNVMPGFEGMERATGTNVASLLLDMIRGDFS